LTGLCGFASSTCLSATALSPDVEINGYLIQNQQQNLSFPISKSFPTTFTLSATGKYALIRLAIALTYCPSLYAYDEFVESAGTGTLIQEAAVNSLSLCVTNPNISSYNLALIGLNNQNNYSLIATYSTPSLLVNQAVHGFLQGGKWIYYHIDLSPDDYTMTVNQTSGGPVQVFARFGACPDNVTWDFIGIYNNSTGLYEVKIGLLNTTTSYFAAIYSNQDAYFTITVSSKTNGSPSSDNGNGLSSQEKTIMVAVGAAVVGILIIVCIVVSIKRVCCRKTSP